MKLLLLDIEFDQNAAGSLRKTRWTHHPLGLMYLAAAVKESIPDSQVRILHSATCEDFFLELSETIRQFQPEVVGLRSLSLFQEQFAQVARFLREQHPELPLLGGGPYASASYREIMENGIVDLVVREEGERTLVELLGAFQQTGALPTNVAGTVVREGGEVVVNPPREVIAELDEISFPDYSLIRLDDYSGFSNHAFQSCSQCVFVYTSRGCPYKCFYCHVANAKTVRRRSPENVLTEMKQHYERGLRNFVFVDDIFNVPPKVGKAILRRVVEELPGITVNFPNGLRADQLDDEFLDLLEEAGCCHLALAVETATPRLQKMVGKFMRLDRCKTMVEKASRRFITCGLFMVGFPTETREEAMATLEFARDLTHLVQPVLNIVRVYPGTPLYDVLKPNPEQARKISAQSSAALLPGLLEEQEFYGDYFSDQEVPLKTQDISELRWWWMRHVVSNPERISRAHGVVRRYFEEEAALEFYRNMFDKPGMKLDDVERMLEMGRSDLFVKPAPYTPT